MQDASINTGFPLCLNWLELVCGLKNAVTTLLPTQQVSFRKWYLRRKHL